MKDIKTEYCVINVFSDISEAERKTRINKAIKTLCVLDIEKSCDLDYNIGVAFHGSVSDLQKGGTQ